MAERYSHTLFHHKLPPCVSGPKCNAKQDVEWSDGCQQKQHHSWQPHVLPQKPWSVCRHNIWKHDNTTNECQLCAEIWQPNGDQNRGKSGTPTLRTFMHKCLQYLHTANQPTNQSINHQSRASHQSSSIPMADRSEIDHSIFNQINHQSPSNQLSKHWSIQYFMGKYIANQWNERWTTNHLRNQDMNAPINWSVINRQSSINQKTCTSLHDKFLCRCYAHAHMNAQTISMCLAHWITYV